MRKETRTVEETILSEDEIRILNYNHYIKLSTRHVVLRHHDDMYICRKEGKDYRILDHYTRGER